MFKKAVPVAVSLGALALIGGSCMSGGTKTNANVSGSAPAVTSNVSTEPIVAADSTTVTYTAEGFSPASITVSAGDTVTFANDSSSSMRVASDPHPSHTDLAALGGGETIPSGGTYSFTFEEPGEWGYHNHLSPLQRGTVIVE